MSATLDALQMLQQVTLKLTALRSKIERKKRSVRSHDHRQAVHEAELAAKHEVIMQRQSAVDQLELQVKTHEAQTIQLREALNKTKTNKEYAALLTQINTGKADNSKVEDRVLEGLNELEKLRGEEQVILSKIEDEKQALANARKAAEAFERDSQVELEALGRERAETASAVPSSTLSVFERVAGRHDGEALAQVIQPHPKRQEFMCDGCNMGVTLEQFVTLQAGSDIQLCNSCGRVLFLDE
jgi:predicted  nucleic acid-binding Zn-ribbon protein